MAEIEDMRLDAGSKAFRGVKALRWAMSVGRVGTAARGSAPAGSGLKTGALDNTALDGAVSPGDGRSSSRLTARHHESASVPASARRWRWAITVATIGQLQICRGFGLKRLLLANQLVGRQPSLCRQRTGQGSAFEFYALADSIEGVAMIAAAAKRAGLGRPVICCWKAG